MTLKEVTAAALAKSFTGATFRHTAIEQLPQLAAVLHPGATLYYYQFWKDARLVGYAIIRRVRGILADLSFGPVLLDKNDYHECIRLLQPALRKHLLMILRVLPPPDFPSIRGLAGKLDWATLVVDISKDEDGLLRSFSPNHRQSITKARDAGIAIKKLGKEEAESYTSGYLRMFSSRGFEKNKALELKAINCIIHFANEHPEEAFVQGAYHPQSGKLIGGGIFLRSGDTYHYYQGFSEKQTPSLPVLHLLLFSAMLEAKGQGCRRFDLYGYSLSNEDAQLKAVNDFKRWFRGSLITHPPTAIIPLYTLLMPVLRRFGRDIF